MSATVTRPVTLTDAMLVSSTVPENDHPEWAAPTSYTVGQRVMRSAAGVHKNFENLIAGINATLPEQSTAGVSPRWLNLGPTNRWAMFDTKVGTGTSIAVSTSRRLTTILSSMTVVLKPGNTDALYLGSLTGKTAVVTAKNATGGTQVYNRTVNLDGTIIGSFYEWFFTDFVQKTDVLLSDLPNQYHGLEVTITLTADAGNVSIGVCHLGRFAILGESKMGAGVGIISYTKKLDDGFGNITVLRPKNPNANRMSLQIMVTKERFPQVFNLLKSLDGILCIYSAVELDGFEPFNALGFYKDFYITVEYFSHYLVALEVEGVN